MQGQGWGRAAGGAGGVGERRGAWAAEQGRAGQGRGLRCHPPLDISRMVALSCGILIMPLISFITSALLPSVPDTRTIAARHAGGWPGSGPPPAAGDHGTTRSCGPVPQSPNQLPSLPRTAPSCCAICVESEIMFALFMASCVTVFCMCRYSLARTCMPWEGQSGWREEGRASLALGVQQGRHNRLRRPAAPPPPHPCGGDVAALHRVLDQLLSLLALALYVCIDTGAAAGAVRPPCLAAAPCAVGAGRRITS